MENCIINFLTGKASQEEIEHLAAWRKESEENEKLFLEYEAVWKVSSGLEHYLIPNKESVWNQIIAKIQIAKTDPLYSRSILIRIASVAAVVTLVLGLSFSLLINPNELFSPAAIIVKAPKGQKTEVVLPDGSMVWLNSETVITYNTDFNRKERRITLEGEAFFDVVHNSSKRFVVESSNVQVVVHGTSFNVRAYSADPSMDVALLEGHVTIRDGKKNKLLADLRPNQRGVVNKTDHTCSVEECNADDEAIWRLERLKINGDNIHQLAQKLKRWYDVDITIEGEAACEEYWLTIKNESLTEILDVINLINPIRYTINGKNVTIHFEE